MSQSFESLPTEERVAHYREMARRVMEMANPAHGPETRAESLDLAEKWLALAVEIERQCRERVPEAAMATESQFSPRLN